MNLKLFATSFVLAGTLQATTLDPNEPQAIQSKLFKQKSNWGVFNPMINTVKSNMNRKTFVMRSSTDEIFSSMGVLKSNKSYAIKIYRGGDPSTHFPPAFLAKPEDTPIVKGEKLTLIQTTPKSDTRKKLCIMTLSTKSITDNIDHDLFQHFIRDIIAVEPEKQQEIFKKYKDQIGLPGLSTNFTFRINAWETEYDCALYNIGEPEFYYPGFPEPQAKTEVFSKSFSEPEKDFAVQISQPQLNDKLLTVLQVKSNANGPSSLRVQPLKDNYDSITKLLSDLVPHTDDIVKAYDFGDRCAAIISQTDPNLFNKVPTFPHAINVHHKKGLDILKNKLFHSQETFNLFLNSFPGSHTISFTSWKKENDTCGYPAELITTDNE